jgi:hypothetical protein
MSKKKTIIDARSRELQARKRAATRAARRQCKRMEIGGDLNRGRPRQSLRRMKSSASFMVRSILHSSMDFFKCRTKYSMNSAETFSPPPW